MEYINLSKTINTILYFAKNVNFLGKTKLYKLLYFLDFTHFKETGRSITGYNYFAWDFGPVPKTLYEELDCAEEDLPEEFKKKINITRLDKFHEIKAKAPVNMNVFSKREIRILEELSDIFKYVRAKDIKKISHLKGDPWNQTIETKGEYQQIDYLLSLDDSSESISKEEAEEKQVRFNETVRLING